MRLWLPVESWSRTGLVGRTGPWAHRVVDFGSRDGDSSTSIDDSMVDPGPEPRKSRHADETGHMPEPAPQLHGCWRVMSPLACSNPLPVTQPPAAPTATTRVSCSGIAAPSWSGRWESSVEDPEGTPKAHLTPTAPTSTLTQPGAATPHSPCCTATPQPPTPAGSTVPGDTRRTT
jgi:hypothetical protein